VKIRERKTCAQKNGFPEMIKGFIHRLAYIGDVDRSESCFDRWLEE